MKRAVLVLLFVFVVATGTTTWGQCPEPNDSGECDSLLVELYKVDSLANPPIFPIVQILVSHDIVDPLVDSLRGFVIPLCYTFTGPATYCSISTYWNGTTLNPYDPAMARSIFRDLPNNDNPEIYNRMFSIDRDFSQRGWDFIELNLADTSGSHFWLTMVPTGSKDQSWWEGDRVLLATMTFKADDETEICIDSCLWPPTGQLGYSNTNAVSYIPRHKLPVCISCVDVRELEGSEDSRPSEFRLAQNYPNPFNPATNIEFSLVKATHVQIEIFNIVGQKVKTLVDEEMKAGNYLADWDGTDQSGDPVSSGIYFYRMKTDEFSDMKKMLLVK